MNTREAFESLSQEIARVLERASDQDRASVAHALVRLQEAAPVSTISGDLLEKLLDEVEDALMGDVIELREQERASEQKWTALENGAIS
jgi:hypothetical protein